MSPIISRIWRVRWAWSAKPAAIAASANDLSALERLRGAPESRPHPPARQRHSQLLRASARRRCGESPTSAAKLGNGILLSAKHFSAVHQSRIKLTGPPTARRADVVLGQAAQLGGRGDGVAVARAQSVGEFAVRLDEVGQHVRGGQQAVRLHRRYDECSGTVGDAGAVHDADRVRHSNHDLESRMTMDGSGRRRAAVHRVTLADGEPGNHPYQTRTQSTSIVAG